MIKSTCSAIWLALLAIAVGAGCSQPETRSFDGVADGEYVRVAASLSGSLASLNVKRGTRVRQGEQLFALDAQPEMVSRRQAQSRVDQAQTRLAEAHRQGNRAVIQDVEAGLKVAQAELAEAQFRLEQKTAKAPTGGVVVDTLYTEGQWVPGGAPVVSIVAPDAMKVRFFVPAHIVGALRHGQHVRLKCTPCNASMHAEITYISPIATVSADAQNAPSAPTPRFLVEAKPQTDEIAALRPGIAVQVLL